MSALGHKLQPTTEDGPVEPTVEAPDGIWEATLEDFEATLDSALERLAPTLETGFPKRF